MEIRQFICRWTGHWFSEIDKIVFEIKTNPLNNDMTATITCNCCKQVFVHKNSPNAKSDTGVTVKIDEIAELKKRRII